MDIQEAVYDTMSRCFAMKLCVIWIFHRIYCKQENAIWRTYCGSQWQYSFGGQVKWFDMISIESVINVNFSFVWIVSTSNGIFSTWFLFHIEICKWKTIINTAFSQIYLCAIIVIEGSCSMKPLVADF